MSSETDGTFLDPMTIGSDADSQPIHKGDIISWKESYIGPSRIGMVLNPTGNHRGVVVIRVLDDRGKVANIWANESHVLLHRVCTPRSGDP